ncbi:MULTISPECIES: hypothetical protein [Burkholderia]|uniref:hypothetical protein n=1 Tax=Burkholderia TaxID=32008 RepID=UPI00192982EB|nr:MULTISPECIES: hypothetical protein [Burkholderia]MBL3961179.1 hypothetical protein [Burkholderia sp. KCJ3K979]MCW3610762.1 hypothetical protein [Burkholderia cenocepacia]MCW5191776.1 hypothetical protein [Burkholderia cenocepacia]
MHSIDLASGSSRPLRAAALQYLHDRLGPRGDEACRLARYSENNRIADSGPITLIDDFPSLQLFDDPLQSQVVAFGVAEAGGQIRPYALRLKVSAGRISEVEEIISTACAGHFADAVQLLKPDVLYEAPVPPHRAAERDQLESVADSYWSALQESDGSLARFAYRCDRYDNGKKITNNLSILLSADAAVHTPASCVYATRPARPIARNRRFPVVDRRLGIVVSFVLVDFHPAPHLDRPDCGTFYMAGVFKVTDGEIRSLDEIREILPLGAAEIW